LITFAYHRVRRILLRLRAYDRSDFAGPLERLLLHRGRPTAGRRVPAGYRLAGPRSHQPCPQCLVQ
jgi:hypothetical protein